MSAYYEQELAYQERDAREKWEVDMVVVVFLAFILAILIGLGYAQAFRGSTTTVSQAERHSHFVSARMAPASISFCTD